MRNQELIQKHIEDILSIFSVDRIIEVEVEELENWFCVQIKPELCCTSSILDKMTDNGYEFRYIHCIDKKIVANFGIFKGDKNV